jgi:hypothetical protein
MNAPRIASLVVALVLTASVDLFAQQEPPVTPGDRVRVSWLGDAPLVSTVLALRADTLVLDVEGRVAPLELPLALVKKVEVRRGQKSNAGRGARTGGLLGAMFGLLVGVVAWTGCDSDDSSDSCESAVEGIGVVAIGVGIFGGVGAGVGAIIGALSTSDRWEEVPMDRLRVSLVPQHRGGLAVSVSVAF